MLCPRGIASNLSFRSADIGSGTAGTLVGLPTTSATEAPILAVGTADPGTKNRHRVQRCLLIGY